MPKTTTTSKPKPRLKEIDDLLSLNEEQTKPSVNTPPQSIPARDTSADTYYAVLPLADMQDYPGHPFRRYEGERKADMVDSIREKGILQPLILWEKTDDSFYILAGHNRKDCAIEAGYREAPVIMKRGLTDEEAWIYVIETNLIQRSFTDLLPSEKAAVLAAHHSKLFSQGKRNDIRNELKELEKAHSRRENGTSTQVAHKLKSRDIVGKEYALSKDTVARYLRIDKLVPALKDRLDCGDFAFIPAIYLSFLKPEEQAALDKCLALNKFKVDMRKAETLRDYSRRGKLNEEKLYLILNGELGRKPPQKRYYSVTLKREVYNQYFPPEWTAAEVKAYVLQALEFYFAQKELQKPGASPMPTQQPEEGMEP